MRKIICNLLMLWSVIGVSYGQLQTEFRVTFPYTLMPGYEIGDMEVGMDNVMIYFRAPIEDFNPPVMGDNIVSKITESGCDLINYVAVGPLDFIENDMVLIAILHFMENTDYNRDFIFTDSRRNSVSFTMKGPKGNYTPLSVTFGCEQQNVLPGEAITFKVMVTAPEATPLTFLLHYNEGQGWSEVERKTSVPGAVEFSGKYPPGRYKVTIAEYPHMEVAGIDAPYIWQVGELYKCFESGYLDKDGGLTIMALLCENSNGREDVYFEKMIDNFNNGLVPWWNPAVYVYGWMVQGASLLHLYYGPNLSGQPIVNRMFMYNSLMDDPEYVGVELWNDHVVQPAGGTLHAQQLQLTANPGSHGFSLNDFQPFVQYALFRDGIEVDRKEAFNTRIYFNPQTLDGTYTAKAIYQGHSVDMVGRHVINTTVPPVDPDPEPDPTPDPKNYNYIKKLTARESATTLDETNSNVQVTYYDGLGRPSQIVNVKASYSEDPVQSKDIVTPVYHDEAGNDDARAYLPYVSEYDGGLPNLTPFAKQEQYYTALFDRFEAKRAYNEKVYEASPLNRVMKEIRPGTPEMSTQVNYFTNASSGLPLGCYKFKVAGTRSACSVSYAGMHRENELHVTHSKSDQYEDTYEFKNQSGQVLLSRVRGYVDEQEFYTDTYYVYDSYGNLCYVLMPELSEKLRANASLNLSDESEEMRNHAFVYKYDKRNRCVSKRIPGADWTYHVYDAADRLVFSQDGNQRGRNEWTFTLPDIFGRTVLTGTCTSASRPVVSVVAKAQRSNATNTYKGYTVNISMNNPQVLSADYYDDYAFMGYNGFPSSNDAKLKYDAAAGSGEWYYPSGGFGQRHTGSYKGLQTGRMRAVLGQSDNAPDNIYVLSYYDGRGRLVQENCSNHLGGYSSELLLYDFTGNVLSRAERHSVTASEGYTILLNSYSYDRTGRLLSEQSVLDGGTVADVSYKYDALGTPKGQIYGRSGHTVEQTFTHDIRGWLTRSESPFWDADYGYYVPTSDRDIQSRTTGDITELSWLHKGLGADGMRHTYAFDYDGFSRLCGARYFEGDNWRETSQNTEKGIRYDLNGNITSLRRYGLSDLENDLVYSYDGNRLSRLTDRVGSRQYSYRYDSNGNCTFDGLNNLELTYNSLNLVERAVIGTSPVLGASVVSGSAATTVLLPPDSEVPDGPETLPGLEIPGGVVTARTEYRWLSDGTKAGATSYDGTGLSSGYEYLGSLIYSSNGSRLNLQDAGFGHGRLTSSGVEYHLRDHLGSTRVVFDETSEALARNDYMPFGRKWDGGFIQSAANNRWLYNGKESQSSLGVNYLDYGSRMYCPQSGRWLTIDPLTEKYHNISPFAYCANNPVMYVDPTGEKLIIFYRNDKGQEQRFTYTGKETSIPDNRFVRQVVEAVDYNISNGKNAGGGGEPSQKAVQADYGIIIKETESDSKHRGGVVLWNPELGNETMPGIVRSPASILDHELDHGVQKRENPEKFEKDRTTKDNQYGTKEERRVITGSEQRTALANGEIQPGQVTRRNHDGRQVKVDGGVTGTTINENNTREFHEKERRKNLTGWGRP